MAAKRTAELIPLCHPLQLSHVDVDMRPRPRGYVIRARVRTLGRTGVEMEALVAVTAAALTLYDMLKAVDRAMVIGAVRLLEKRGGRSGHYRALSPMRLRIVAAVHDPPVWMLPSHEVQRIAAALPEADVIDARDAEVRRRELPRADILLGTQLTLEEARLATQLKWIQSTAVGVGAAARAEIVEGDVVVTNARGVHSQVHRRARDRADARRSQTPSRRRRAPARHAPGLRPNRSNSPAPPLMSRVCW